MRLLVSDMTRERCAFTIGHCVLDIYTDRTIR